MSAINASNTTNDGKMEPIRLDTLPGDLLGMICREFCSHCVYPDVPFSFQMSRDTYCEFHSLFDCDDMEGTAQEPLWQMRKPLLALSRACRRLRNVAQPLLFHRCLASLSFPPPPLPWSQRVRGDWSGGALLSLLRTLLDRPDLARAVRYAEVASDLVAFVSNPQGPDETGGMMDTIADGKQQPPKEMQRALDRLGLHVPAFVDWRAGHTLLRCLRQLVVVQLAGVECLQVFLPSDGKPAHEALWVFAELFGTTPETRSARATTAPATVYFPALVSLAFDESAALDTQLSLFGLSGFLAQAPALRRLHARDVLGDPEDPAPPSAFAALPALGRVTRLQILSIRYTLPQLFSLLDACGPLTEFSYHNYLTDLAYHREQEGSRLIQNLARRHAATMEKLHICMASHEGAPAASISRFSRLRHLYVDPYTMMGSPDRTGVPLADPDELIAILPASLETLQLGTISGGQFTSLAALLEGCQTHHPHLRRVNIGHLYHGISQSAAAMDTVAVMDTITELSSKAGVSLVVQGQLVVDRGRGPPGPLRWRGSTLLPFSDDPPVSLSV